MRLPDKESPNVELVRAARRSASCMQPERLPSSRLSLGNLSRALTSGHDDAIAQTGAAEAVLPGPPLPSS